MKPWMALKIQNKKDMAKDKKELQHIRDEKNLMFAMSSPFLVSCIDYFQDVYGAPPPPTCIMYIVVTSTTVDLLF
jgi:hypothetical protein